MRCGKSATSLWSGVRKDPRSAVLAVGMVWHDVLIGDACCRPMNGRYALKDTTLPRGGGEDGLSPIFIGKDDIVSCESLLSHVYLWAR